MQTIRDLLQPDPPAAASPAIVLREPQPGDLAGWFQQHGEVYAREYGWNASFEALVAAVIAKYQRNLQPDWERGWIAEVNGQKAGSVFVVRKSKTVAQLRLLILHPQARGLGLGGRLTDEVIAYARAKGYRKLVLWDHQCLTAARAIYAKRGFRLTHSETHEGYGSPQVGETWELKPLNLALLAAAATGVQVGAAIVATRMAVADVPPLTLAMLRYGIGFMCLLPFVIKQNRPLAHMERAVSAIKSVATSDLAAMAALGIGQFGVLIALLNFGLQHIGAAPAALIFSLFPLLTLLLSSLLGREPVSLRLATGCCCPSSGWGYRWRPGSPR